MYDKEYFKKLANAIMFNLSDEEAIDIVNEFSTLNKQLELLQKVDTEGVEPMIYPFEQPTSYLREDDESRVITREEALSNVEESKEGHFVVHKVVK